MSRYDDFPAPAGLRTRGTVVVVPGRGETRGAYVRFGRRLAADAYHVRVVEAPSLTEPLERFAAELASATADLADRPLVFAGSDAGAAALAVLVAGGATAADGLVLAGLPGASGVNGSWEDELDVRTSCPVHREVLAAQPVENRGALTEPLPATLAYPGGIEVPQLVLIGAEDPLADREGLARAVKSAPRARLSVVHGAHHDVLNDRQHRSVAAEVVSFLETLGNELVPVISVESSAW
ncbi:alpha/beta hydrolase [Amycolatopsis jejuensis]|uniref:alpha/beta hydrolase n=1 Tax=Amycolatopsis jejuensis TaxID=330084 RepID=UPI0005264180|nr:alpha/beta hydrolase [Amycolatopsis jejuensis]